MSDLINAIKQICEEKGLEYEAVLSTIEMALAAAYRKDFGEKNQNIKVNFDPKTMSSEIFDVKEVVDDVPEEELEEMAAEEEAREAKNNEEKDGKRSDSEKNEKQKNIEDKEGEAENDKDEERRFNPKTMIQISDAKQINKNLKIGDEMRIKLDAPSDYGRMAAQTAKQVIVQKLREAEREMVFGDFKDKEGEVVSGVIQRREPRFVLVDLGKASGYLSTEEQIRGERYFPGERIKVYIKEVRMGHKGAEIILSRRSEEILKKIFYLEIPEISNGLVDIKAVAREAGSRSKVAIHTESDNVDPIGSCVGQRGARIQTIISELGGEKVDIIEYNEDPAAFIANALSPAKIISIELKKDEKSAEVKVANDQLSLAIGKNGQNVRLAARLTGWKIDIIGEDGKATEIDAQEEQLASENEDNKKEKKNVKKDEKLKEDPEEKNTTEDKKLKAKKTKKKAE